ncbi:hypothetical protein FS749_007720 [Ceratobasidium sp. UAMH 11750]|nr:hypothetical protein FS749_007720 [Ceratobasidium sp. UAMH 11750]
MIARIAARPARVIPARITAVRFYTENQFGRKEKAHEDEYVRKHQQEQLKKLQEALKKSKEATAELERQVKEHEDKANGKH